MVIQIVFSIVIWGSVAIALLRALGYGGLRIGSKNKASIWIYKEIEQPHNNSTVSVREGMYIMGSALTFRLLVYLISVLAIMIFVTENEPVTFQTFLEHWRQWDASNYIRIATGGYTYHTENGDFLTLVFFPLYSVLIRMMYAICRSYEIAALLTSSLCYSAACYYIYALVCLDYGKETAKKTVIYISIFPTAFFFGSMMTESVFLLVTAACFYYIRQKKWLCAGVFGALAAFSRMIGILMIVPAGIAWIEAYRPFERIKQRNWKALRQSFPKLLSVLLMFLGILGYLFINYKTTGNWFAFMAYQDKYWHHENCYFAKTVNDIFRYAFASGTDNLTRAVIWIPEMLVFSLTAIALCYGMRKHKSMYIIYLAAYMVINCSVTWLISGMRYMSVAIPLFIILADFTQKHKWLDKWIIVGFSMLFGLFLTGYLFSKQIM